MKRLILLTAAIGMLAAVGCKTGPGYNLPPLERLMAPGPGVNGPGPGVLSPAEMAGGRNPGGGVEQAGFVDDGNMGMAANSPTVQVMFARPAGMQVSWDVSGSGSFGATPLVAPGRTNFSQAGLYRLKLQNVPGHEGMELYPTLEVGPANPRTLSYLVHNAIPLQLTVDDFNQVTAGNFVTKVIYLPDADYQELAVAGVETLVSTRLDPGVDPVVEADRRGSVLAILRIGNKDIEMPGMAHEDLAYFGSLGNPGAGGGGGGGGHGGPTSPGGPIYGMPSSGTPIGLAGPPHIPFGGQAGMQKHVIRNHTRQYVPDPSKNVKIHVKQQPGVSYPAPRNRAWIKEYNHPDCSRCAGRGCALCR